MTIKMIMKMMTKLRKSMSSLMNLKSINLQLSGHLLNNLIPFKTSNILTVVPINFQPFLGLKMIWWLSNLVHTIKDLWCKVCAKIDLKVQKLEILIQLQLAGYNQVFLNFQIKSKEDLNFKLDIVIKTCFKMVFKMFIRIIKA